MNGKSVIRQRLERLKHINIMVDNFTNTKSRTPRAMTENTSIAPAFKPLVEALKAKIKINPQIHIPYCPPSERLKYTTSTDRQIGPGSYCKSMNVTHRIKVPRTKPGFHKSLAQKSLSLEKCKQHNKTVDLFREKRKASIHKTRSDNRKNFKEKYFRKEWAFKKEEIVAIKTNWIVFILLHSLNTVVSNRISHTKTKKQRVAWFLRVFRRFSYIVVKLKHSLRKVRLLLYYKTLIPVQRPIEKMLKRKHKEFKVLIVKTVDKVKYSNYLMRLMNMWLFCIVKIQRNIRKFLFITRNRKIVLRKKWDNLTRVNLDVEDLKTEIVVNKIVHTVHSNKIGPYMKNKYINIYLKERMRNYLIKTQKYFEFTRNIPKTFARNFEYWQFQSFLKSEYRDVTIPAPDRPTLSLFRNTEYFKELIVKASSYIFNFPTPT